MYINILQHYGFEVAEKKDYKKHLKEIISKNISGVNFVQPRQRRKPENLILEAEVSEPVDIRHQIPNKTRIVSTVIAAAKLLRKEVLSHPKWNFNGKLDGFENPPLLQCFLTNLLFGDLPSSLSNSKFESKKVIYTSCQFLVKNTHSTRQVTYQTERGFKQRNETPFSLGLSLAIHSQVRSKSLIRMLKFAKIGTDYEDVLQVEVDLEQAVL